MGFIVLTCVRIEEKCYFRISLDGEGSLLIDKVLDSDEGRYQCFAKNLAGTRGSEKANLAILSKFIFILQSGRVPTILHFIG